MQDRALSNEKIDVMWNSSIVEMMGILIKNGLESVRIKDTITGENVTINAMEFSGELDINLILISFHLFLIWMILAT